MTIGRSLAKTLGIPVHLVPAGTTAELSDIQE